MNICGPPRTSGWTDPMNENSQKKHFRLRTTRSGYTDIRHEITLNSKQIVIPKRLKKISFGGTPNSRSVLFLQILLKSAAKPSARNFSGTLLNLTWLCTKASPTFSGTFSRNLLNLAWLCTKLNLTALHQSLPDLLRNLLRNFIEPDPAPAPVHTGAILGWGPH